MGENDLRGKNIKIVAIVTDLKLKPGANAPFGVASGLRRPNGMVWHALSVTMLYFLRADTYLYQQVS